MAVLIPTLNFCHHWKKENFKSFAFASGKHLSRVSDTFSPFILDLLVHFFPAGCARDKFNFDMYGVQKFPR